MFIDLGYAVHGNVMRLSLLRSPKVNALVKLLLCILSQTE